jgi:N-acetylmuramoyl-L-alanine amidase
MTHLSKFQVDTHPIEFTITDSSDADEEILSISGFDHGADEINLSSPLQHSYSANSQITFQFEVQAFGCQNGDGHWVDIQYNYDMDGGTWDDDNRCSITNESYGPIVEGGQRVGLVEYVENWKIAERVISSLSGASNTRSSMESSKSLYQRGQDILSANADLFVSIHLNASTGHVADDSRMYPLHRTKFKPIEWYEDSPLDTEASKINDQYWLKSGKTYYGKITHDNTSSLYHIRPWPLRNRIVDAGGNKLLSNYLIPKSEVTITHTGWGEDDAASQEKLEFTVPTSAQKGIATLKIRGPHHTIYEDQFANELVSEVGSANPFDGGQKKGDRHWAILRHTSDLSQDKEAIGCLAEMMYYDTAPSARWLHNRGNTSNYDSLAQAVVNAINTQTSNLPSNTDQIFNNLDDDPNSEFPFQLGDLAKVQGQTLNTGTNDSGKGKFELTFKRTSDGKEWTTTSKTFDLDGDGHSDDGAYEILIPAGDYDVTVVMPDGEVGINDVDFHDTTVSLTVPDTAAGMDTGISKDFYMDPYAKIKVTVEDVWAGEGLGGANIEIKDAASGSIEASGQTESRYGNFDSGNIDSGVYDIYVDHPDVGSDSALNVRAPKGGVTWQLFQFDLEFTGFHGIITRQFDGEKIGDAQIEADPVSAGDETWEGKSRLASAYLGKYRSEKLSVGDYTLTCSKPGYDTKTTSTLTTVADSSVRKDITIEALPVPLEVYVVEHPGVNVGDTPVDLASVSWERKPSGSVTGSGITDSNGYLDEEITFGEYNVSVSKTDYEPTTIPINLEIGEGDSEVITLHPFGELSGRVTDARNGAVIDGATVKAVRDGNAIQSVTTNSTGDYLLDEVGIGEVNIVVNKQYYASKTVTVTISSSGIKNISLDHQPVVEGTISDANDGSIKISGATVKAFDSDNSLVETVTSNSSGYYHFPGVPAGNVTIQVYHIDYGTHEKTENVSVNTTRTVDFSIEPKTGTVSGKIKDKFSGTGKSYASYEIKNSVGSIVKSADANYHGNYSEVLVTGDYQIKGNTDNYLPSSWLSFTIYANQTTEQDVPLQPYADIKVTVKKEKDDGSIVYAQEETVHLNGTADNGETIDEQSGTGIFEAIATFNLIPPGSYTVSVSIDATDDQPAQDYSSSFYFDSESQKNIYLGP